MKKILKNTFAILFLVFINIGNIFAVSQRDIKPTENTDLKAPSGSKMDIGLKDVFVWLKGEMFDIVFIISVGVIVFIGIRIATARGNPEELKKTWTHLIYFAIGIFLVFSAISIVKLVADLGNNFS